MKNSRKHPSAPSSVSFISRRLILHISLCIFALMQSGCVKDDPESSWSLEAGAKLPEFTVTMNDGRIVTPESLRGKESIIIFFNTSCSDCRRELPLLQQEYERMKEEGGGVEYICISREEDAASVESYWAANGLTMPYSAQPDRAVYNLFASSGIPRIYYVSPQLTITKAILAE